MSGAIVYLAEVLYREYEHLSIFINSKIYPNKARPVTLNIMEDNELIEKEINLIGRYELYSYMTARADHSILEFIDFLDYYRSSSLITNYEDGSIINSDEGIFIFRLNFKEDTFWIEKND